MRQGVLLTTGGALFGLSLLLGARHEAGAEQQLSCRVSDDCRALGDAAICFVTSAKGGRCESGLPPPPTPVLSEALALGRRSAAADIAWMQTIHFVGAPWAEVVGFSGMAEWIDLITTLDPQFRVPYMYGGILLATSPEQARKADRILARGEASFDDDEAKRIFAQWRGFVTYYGMLDPGAAAEHYRRAYELGGPYVLKQRAETLSEQSAGCREVWRNLKETITQLQGQEGGQLLKSRARQRSILQHCFRESIQAAAGTYKLEHKKDATSVQQLVDTGLLDEVPPTLEKGKCWKLIRAKAYVRECATKEED